LYENIFLFGGEQMEQKQKEFEKDVQICTHFAEDKENHYGAAVPPIYENSLHVYKNFHDFVAADKDEKNNYMYWRGTNPTVDIAERKLAALERGESCKCFASGMAAISAALLTFLKSGDHVLFVSNIYGPTLDLLKYLHKFNVDHSVVYSTDMASIEEAVQTNTRVIYVESPTTMTFHMVDLNALSLFAKERNIRTIIDNTWATPLFQKPLTMGIDVVVHSVTKYLGGHSDIVGGAIITNETLMGQIFYNEFLLFGGVMPPYEAWLLIRGLRTLPLRMKGHQESALKVAHFLQDHPAVRKVNYPALETHPNYELGKRQLTGYSGLMSFELHQESFENVANVINALEIFQIGFSFGSFESLVLSPNHGDNIVKLNTHSINPGLIRISVGLESVDSLIQDLNNALTQTDK
jgi:cystathionine beta-lyase